MTVINTANNQSLAIGSSPSFVQTTLAALNPGIAYTGTWSGPFQFTTYESSTFQGASFTNNVLCATFDGLNSTPTQASLLTLNLGTISILANSAASTAGFFMTAANLTSFTANSLTLVQGGMQVTFNGITSSAGFVIPALSYIGGAGAFIVTMNSFTGAFSYPNIAYIGGQMTLTLPLATSIVLDGVVFLASQSNSGNMASATTFSMAALTTVSGGNFNFPVMSALTTLNLPNLATCSNAFQGLNAPLLTTFNMPSLISVGGAFNQWQLASCTSFLVPSLQTIGTNFNSMTAPVLTTFNLPSIVSIGGAFAITTVSLVTFSFGSTLKALLGNVTITGAALSQASVDGILVSLAALDGTGGTTAYSSLTINLSGGTSSAPSATGLAAKVILVARSCTVTTN